MINKDNSADNQIELAEELVNQLNICGIDEDGADLLTILDALSCGALALVEAPGIATEAYYRVLNPDAKPAAVAFAAQRLGQSVVKNDK